MERPLIAINADVKCQKDLCFSVLQSGYYEALQQANAVPIIIPPLRDISAIECILNRVNGVVLSGGGDLDPEHDGWQRHAETRCMHEARESFDRVFVRKIMEKKIPVLGIGAGMQLLNVACDGHLSLHIPEDFPKAMDHTGKPGDLQHRHQIYPRKGTWIHKVYGESNVFVTSYHHMCVQELSPSFEISAVAADNIIETIESRDPTWFAVGVQFHPEVSISTVLDGRLFEEFATFCDPSC